MRYIVEEPLRNFRFWGGARVVADNLTNEELDCIEEYLESTDSEYTETEINDIFWFETELIESIIDRELFPEEESKEEE